MVESELATDTLLLHLCTDLEQPVERFRRDGDLALSLELDAVVIPGSGLESTNNPHSTPPFRLTWAM